MCTVNGRRKRVGDTIMAKKKSTPRDSSFEDILDRKFDLVAAVKR